MRRAEVGGIEWAAEERGFDKDECPLDIWRDPAGNIEQKFCLAVALAASKPTMEEQNEARNIAYETVEGTPAAGYYALVMDIASLLGDRTLADAIAEKGMASIALSEVCLEAGWPHTQ